MARTESRWLPTTTIASLVGAATLLLSTACTSQPTTTPTQTMSSPAARKLRAPETLLGLPKSMDREGIGLAQRHLDKLKREVGQPTSAIGWPYANKGPDADAVLISGASGTITDQQGAIERALRPYRIDSHETVDAGELGGTARCGRGRPDEVFLIVCAWADDQTLGVVVFLSSRPQADRTTQFLEVRKAVTEPAA